jgi:hypothetical protein
MIGGGFLQTWGLSEQILLAGYWPSSRAEIFICHAVTRQAIYLEQETDIDVRASQTRVQRRCSAS